MIPISFLIFSIICFSLYSILQDFVIPPSNKKVRDLKIPKKRFVLNVLDWCSTNLGSLKYGYELDIKYHRHKEFAGYYFNYSRTIQIFVFDELSLLDLTETIIHEYIHHLQYNKKKTDIEYNKCQNEIGYWDNPFEVEARRLSKIHKNQCYEDVVNSKRIT